MKKIATVTITLTIFILVFLLNSGCEVEQNQPNVRRTRLIADENLRLTADLKRLNRELDKQIKLLEECRQKWAQSKKNSDKLTASIMEALGECNRENLKLKEENEGLKAKLKRLQSENN